MENEINAWLEDIDMAIEEIFSFLPEKRNFFESQKDFKGKPAIERSFEMIGEAIHRFVAL